MPRFIPTEWRHVGPRAPGQLPRLPARGSVTMAAIAAVGAVISVPVKRTQAQTPAATGQAPKTPWENLRGDWTVDSDTPLRRPAKYANQESFTAAQRRDDGQRTLAEPPLLDRPTARVWNGVRRGLANCARRRRKDGRSGQPRFLRCRGERVWSASDNDARFSPHVRRHRWRCGHGAAPTIAHAKGVALRESFR
jgi:hypothetical protein